MKILSSLMVLFIMVLTGCSSTPIGTKEYASSDFINYQIRSIGVSLKAPSNFKEIRLPPKGKENEEKYFIDSRTISSVYVGHPSGSRDLNVVDYIYWDERSRAQNNYTGFFIQLLENKQVTIGQPFIFERKEKITENHFHEETYRLFIYDLGKEKYFMICVTTRGKDDSDIAYGDNFFKKTIESIKKIPPDSQ